MVSGGSLSQLPYQKKIERSRTKAPIQSSTIGMKALTFKASREGARSLIGMLEGRNFGKLIVRVDG